jgi:hypothetical protein
MRFCKAAFTSSQAAAANFPGEIARLLAGVRGKSYRSTMMTRKLARWILAALLLSSAAASLAATLNLSQEQGDRLERKIEEITKNASLEPVRPKKTPVTEPEVNSYLNFNLKEKIPRGLTNPRISLLGTGNLGGTVFVDLNEFNRHRRSGGITDPFAYISGRVPLAARGVLRTQDGKGQFRLISADIHGIPIPQRLLQELVTYFSRTQDNPRGINIDEPFNLPAKIREVIVHTGDAVVTQ